MKKLNIILLSLMFSIACSGVKTLNGSEELNRPLVDTISEITVPTGKVKYQRFAFRKPDGIYQLNCGNKTFRFLVKEQTGHIYLPASYFSSKSSKNCIFLDGDKEVNPIKLAIEEFDYPKEKLNVPKGKVDYSKKDIERIIREKEIKRKIYLNSSNMFLFNKPFKVPLKSYITSHYGNQRLFNNKKKSQHLGNDLRAATGVKIPAANRGKVVYTGDLFFSGKVVVVDHGMDIFSIYGHLSKIIAKEGEMVEQGEIVGLAGATGRVSGPHLHWGVRINGSWIDGFSLIEESKKHFKNES